MMLHFVDALLEPTMYIDEDCICRQHLRHYRCLEAESDIKMDQFKTTYLVVYLQTLTIGDHLHLPALLIRVCILPFLYQMSDKKYISTV